MLPVPVTRLPLLALVALGLAVLPSASLPAAERPIAVSPGAERDAPAVTSPCPTFSWALADGARGYELVVLDVAEVAESRPPRPMLERRFSAGLGSWTPSGKECLLAGGTYAWTVRALDGAGRPTSGDTSWSTPLRFRVPGQPSAEEVTAALEVLRRWQAAGRVDESAVSSSDREPIAEARRVAPTRAAEVSGTSAVRGENPAASGSNFGVTGVSSSTSGAGLVGINLSSGPDLILDGVASGEVDTIFTQAGIDRASADTTAFNIENSGAGAMKLSVDGSLVDTETTPITWTRLVSVPAGFADGLDNDTIYTAGNQLQLVGSLFHVLEGHGSDLDADTLDGAHGASFQTRVTGTCPAGEAVQGVNADGSVACIEVPAPPRITTVDDAATIVGDYSSITLGSDGFPVIAYHGGALKVAKCHDTTCATSSTSTVDAGNVGYHTSILLGLDGLPVISYFDFTAGALKVAKCNDAACAPGGETITTVDDLPNDVGYFTSIALGTDGFPVISYYDITAHSLKVAKCNDAACAPGGETITTVDDPANFVGQYTSIAVGTDGLPVISYYDETDLALKVAKCNDVACAPGGEVITTVDNPVNNVGVRTSLALGTDSFPVISYQDETGGALKVARCTNASCTTRTISAVDVPDGFRVGSYSSITLGADGFPVISYYDETAGALKVAKCNDAACAGFNETITTVDAPADTVGLFTSITLGTDGFPVISYHDSTAGALKVAKCKNASCNY